MDSGTVYLSGIGQTTNNLLAVSSSNLLTRPALLDPVSKLRICQPEALIDTDFEYGLQHSKWETLEMINNIPTFFTRSGDTVIPLTSVTGTVNSYLVTVVTSGPHNLIEGSPIIMQGTESPTADGAFIVYHVINATSFVYMAKDIQTITNLYDPYSTYLFAGRVYQSTMFNHEFVRSIITDGVTPQSSLTIYTNVPHGIDETTNIMLSGSLGRKVVTVDGATGVDFANTTTVTSAVTNTATKRPSTTTNTWASYPIIPHNWIAKYQVHFESTDVDIANNTITIPNHGLTSNDTVMYVPAASPNTPVGGLTPYTIYKVSPSSANILQLQPYTVTAPSAGLVYYRYGSAYFADNMGFFRANNHTSTGTVTDISSITAFGLTTTSTTFSLDVMGYFRASSTGTWTFSLTADDAAYLWLGNGAIYPATNNALINNGGVHTGNVTVTATISLVANQYYPIRIYHGANATGAAQLKLEFSGPGVTTRTNGSTFFFNHDAMTFANISVSPSVVDFTSQGTSAGQSHMLMKAYVVRSVDATLDSLDVDINTQNAANIGMPYGQGMVIMSGDATYGRGFGVNDFQSTTSVYTISSTEYTTGYLSSKPVTIGATSSTIYLNTTANGAAINIRRSVTHGLTWVVPYASFSYPNSFIWLSHGLANNQALTYTKASGTSPTVLVGDTPTVLADGTYYAEVRDGNWIRLRTAVDGSTLDVIDIGNGTFTFSKTVTNPTQNQLTSVLHGLINGQRVIYNANGNTPIPGLSDASTYYVSNSTRDTFRLSSTEDLASIIDFTGVSSGIHKFALEVKGTDTSFVVSQILDTNRFTVTAPFEIPYYDFVFDPRKTVWLDNGGYWYIPNHNMMYWNEVQYLANGNPVIGGLTDGGIYYINRLDNNFFRLSTAYSSSASVIVNTYSFPQTNMGTNHILRVRDIRGLSLLSSKAKIIQNTTTVLCNDIDFLANYRINDYFVIEAPELNSTYYAIVDTDVTSNVLTMSTNPGFYAGTYVQYSRNQDDTLYPITGLSFGNYYFVGNPSGSTLTLHLTYADAIAGTNAIDISGESTDGYLTWTDAALALSANNTTGVITLTSIRTSINGNHLWSHGNVVVYEALGASPIDKLNDEYIYVIGRNGLGNNEILLFASRADADLNTNPIIPSTTYASGRFKRIYGRSVWTPRITELNSKTAVTTNTTFNTSTNNGMIYRMTSVLPRVDGLSLHRAYDGGVELIPSTSPGAQLIRQTRRYFRYQSGKGIQMSKAVNFNSPIDIQDLTRSGTTATITTRTRHRVTIGLEIEVMDAAEPEWNGTYVITSIPTSRTFTYTLTSTPTVTRAGGYPRYKVKQWIGSSMRVGMFDDQNGLYFEYDGSMLYAVRRNSVKQLPGVVTATYNSSTITGVGTRFLTQLSPGERVVIKGMSYKVIRVTNDTTITILPLYRGVTNDNIIMTKTIEVKTPQSQWSIDHCDGNGPSGYNLDLNKIQMLYIDYSWYGAGKARFGFKNTTGEVIYVHEYIHNNLMTEAYLRSGNVTARYEVENTGIPTYVPSLMHWGTSVIMDGGFDDDRAYFFTAAGNQITYAGGDVSSLAGGSYSNFGLNGNRSTSLPFRVLDPTLGAIVDAYRITFSTYATIKNIKPGVFIKGVVSGTDTILDVDTKVVVVTASGNIGYMFVNKKPLTASTSNQAFYAGDPNDELPNLIPLVSIRLSPSVDNNRPGALGSREIINRMQIHLKSIGILTTHDVEIRVLLNPYPYTKPWARPDSTSLSQLILHQKGDTLEGGSQIFTFRASGGAADSGGKKNSQSTTVDIGDIMTLGNSILGGDDIYPNGPDVVTVCASILDTSGIAAATPFTITGRLTWKESQA